MIENYQEDVLGAGVVVGNDSKYGNGSVLFKYDPLVRNQNTATNTVVHPVSAVWGMSVLGTGV